MQTIVFIETNKSGSSREAIRVAERLGYYTVLFTNRRKNLNQREEFPDVHEMIYLHEFKIEDMTRRLANLINQGKMLKGVVSFIDPYVSLAMELSSIQGIDSFTLEAVKNMENKILTRRSLDGCTANIEYVIYSQDEKVDSFIHQFTMGFPCIVKSPASTGSKDVHLVNNEKELQHVIELLSKLYPSESILIEQYIEGPQWLIEALVIDGEVHIMAVIGQEIMNGERFIITGYYTVLEPEKTFGNNLQATLTTIVKRLGMEKGACHFELRQQNGEFKLIEVNPRISGGAMNAILYHSKGINLVETTLKMFLGLPFSLEPSKHVNIYTYYLTLNTRGKVVKVTGKSKAMNYVGVREVYIKPRKGMIVSPPTSMGNRYGYVIAAAPTVEKAKEIALTAAKEIRFYIEELEEGTNDDNWYAPSSKTP